MSSREPSILKTRPRGDTDQLPIDLDISASLIVAVPQLLIGGVFLIAALVFHNSVPEMPDFGQSFGTILALMPLVLAIAGGVYFVRAGIDLVIRRRARITANEVTHSARAPWGGQSWTEPLAAFDGVRWREIVVQRKSNSSSSSSRGPSVYQVLDLAHSTPERCVPLMVTRLNPEEVRPEWERLAKLLVVAAIDARTGDVEVRAAEDVDKSVRELAAEGKIDAGWSDRAPPPGLAVSRSGEADTAKAIEITLTVPRHPLWLYGLLMAAAGLLLILGATDLAFLPFLFGGGLGAGVAWHWRYEQRHPRTVTITRSHVRIDTPMPGNPPYQAEIRHDEIEAVTITRTHDRTKIGARLRIATDRGEFETGAGLSDEALGWLRDMIVSAIAHA